jgi:predicted DNA-binding WGR domain protein
MEWNTTLFLHHNHLTMQKSFTYEDGKSDKFWNISTDGNSFTVRYGKNGTDGQEKTKTFGSAELCKKEAGKLVAEKLKKGYVPEDREGDAREAGNPAAGADGEPDEFFEKYGKRPPVALKKLLGFESEVGDNFSNGFRLEFRDKSSLKTWFQEENFPDSFIEFAVANGSGSTYAFWLVDEDLEKCPIAAFGDEGGIHIVAENMLQLIRLLTYDAEISIGHDEAYYCRFEDGDFERPDRPEFLKWAKANIGVDPIGTYEEAREIIRAAKGKFGKKFDKFLGKYQSDTRNESKNRKLLDVNKVKLLLKN